MILKYYAKFFCLIAVLFFSVGIFSLTYPHENLVINFSSMSPHLNQMLYLRVVDKSTLKEVGRTSQQITTSGFSITLPVIETGKSYFVDFFADHNSNNKYDAPPVDHAWRLELNNSKSGGDTLNFSHNTSFTDINWQYMLTVNFTGMDPHIGQMLELRVENDNTGEEVDRFKVLSIPPSDFQIQIVGLQIGPEYNVQFYADLNNNGIYDAPPTDHAWEIKFTNTSGDASLNFSHNASFTDIKWKYLLTVNLSSMTPHLGQKFELRVVKQDDQQEVGRITLPKILVPDFSIYVPNFELGHDYNIDFYADLNGNGTYDSPPTDHSWRVNFISSTGDYTTNFTHNTGFTDILWPSTTDITQEPGNLPSSFRLEQNFPNPFNPTTTINYTMPSKNFVNLSVFNLIGEQLQILVNEEQEAGSHQINFDGSSLPSGIYFYKISSSNFTETKKMILMK